MVQGLHILNIEVLQHQRDNNMELRDALAIAILNESELINEGKVGKALWKGTKTLGRLALRSPKVLARSGYEIGKGIGKGGYHLGKGVAKGSYYGLKGQYHIGKGVGVGAYHAFRGLGSAARNIRQGNRRLKRKNK